MLSFLLGSICFFSVTWGSPVGQSPACPYTESNHFLSDPQNPCLFYWCLAGSLVVESPIWCAEGSAVEPGFQGVDNPCSVQSAACGGYGSPGEQGDGEVNSVGYSGTGNSDVVGYPDGRSGYDEFYYGNVQAPAPQPAAAPWAVNSVNQAYPSWPVNQQASDPWPNQPWAGASQSYYPAPAPWPNADPWWVPAGSKGVGAGTQTQETTTTTAATTTTTTATTTTDAANAATTDAANQKPTIVHAFGPGFGYGDKQGFIPATAFLTQDASIPGGTLIPYVHDLKACWRSCVYSFNCKGFDFDHHFGSCWLHTDDTICQTPTPKAHNSNYRLVHCATAAPDVTTGGAADTTTGFPGDTTTDPAATTVAPSVTVKVATPFPSMHIVGGILAEGISDVNACLQFCVSNATCQGVDFDTNGNTCWYHSTSTECMPLVAKATCTHYRCGDPCGSGATNTVVPASHAIGGNFITSSTTLGECISSCTAVSTCVAVDFDTTNNINSCWHHSQTTCNAIEAKANCVHVPIGCTAP